MFKSRGPRGPEEVQDCISLFKFSPYWPESGPELSVESMCKCWIWLLESGAGFIDIIDNDAPSYRANLKNSKKAEENPHYKHGFYSVWFVAYISEEFAIEVLKSKDDKEDPIILFMRRWLEHDKDAAVPSPVVPLGPNGEVPKGGLYSFSLVVTHPNGIFDPAQQVYDISDYVDRVAKSAKLISNGFRHNARITLHVGLRWLKGMTEYGFALAREYSDNEGKADDAKKYVLCTTKNTATASLLGLPESNAISSIIDPLSEKWAFKQNDTLYYMENREVKAGLTRDQQYICFLISLGWKDTDIVKKANLLSIKAERFQQHKCSQLFLKSGYIYKQNPKDQVKAKDIQACLRDVAAHEIRGFMFSFYPWPEDLDSLSAL